MGWIDNSGDIIVDAVVTDLGREMLARNDGSFNIVKWTLADDEIDYSLWNPNTSSANSDVDILKTPIFEAFTNELVALRYPLITVSNTNFRYLPNMGSDFSSITIGEKDNEKVGVTISFKQKTPKSLNIIPPEIRDSSFQIQMDDDLLFIEGEVPINITSYGTSIYIVARDQQPTSYGGGQCTFIVRPQSIGSDVWSKVGTGTKPNRTISSKITCVGQNSGLRASITATINEQFTR